jgi:hypothetical protein
MSKKKIKSYVKDKLGIHYGIPEGGSLPDIQRPVITFNYSTGKRTVSYPVASSGVSGGGISGYSGPRGSRTEPKTITEMLPVYQETKYYWVKYIKDGKKYMATEEIEKSYDGNLISKWSVNGKTDDTPYFYSKEELLEHYEIMEEVCPPTTEW